MTFLCRLIGHSWQPQPFSASICRRCGAVMDVYAGCLVCEGRGTDQCDGCHPCCYEDEDGRMVDVESERFEALKKTAREARQMETDG